MSVFIQELVERESRTVDELRELFSDDYVCFLTVEELENEFKQVVTLDNVPLFPGHALVRDQNGKRTQGTKSRMAARARWHERGGPAAP
jgi:hypothetical protein